MKYLQEIRAAQSDPRLLEDLYQSARQKSEEEEFAASLLSCYEESPDDLLYAAWHYRLQRRAQEEQVKERGINWKLAIPLSVTGGLICWLLASTRFDFPDGMPYVFLVWAPISACLVVAFSTATAGKHRMLSVLAVIGLLAFGSYVTLFTKLQDRQSYRLLMVLHLPLLAWIGTGSSILGTGSDHRDRFAFLVKSIEVFITGGLYLVGGGVFVAIATGMFRVLGIELSDEIVRLLLAGVAGSIPVLAVSSVYDPHLSPFGQAFHQGLSRVISTLMWLLLPLTLLVLVIYLVVIPFRFMEPFRSREVLIVYNVMLFAIMGLLIGATPVRTGDVAPKHQSALRRGILAVAILTVLVSLYALSATVYRTVLGGITMNRLTVIGWNSINITILLLLIYKQFRDGPALWIPSLHWVFSRGTLAYIAWGIFLALSIPWLFSG